MKKRKISKFLLATSLSIGSFSSLPFTAPTVYAKEESSSSYGVFLVDFDSETEGMELPDEDDFWAIYDALAGQFPAGTVHAGDGFDGEWMFLIWIILFPCQHLFVPHMYQRMD